VIDLDAEKLDVKGKMCPLPVAYTKRKLESMASGQLLEVTGEGELEFCNIKRWAGQNGHEVVGAVEAEGEFRITIRKKG
jgi:tRNA 2-thiouridine synthesizing protein A